MCLRSDKAAVLTATGMNEERTRQSKQEGGKSFLTCEMFDVCWPMHKSRRRNRERMKYSGRRERRRDWWEDSKVRRGSGDGEDEEDEGDEGEDNEDEDKGEEEGDGEKEEEKDDDDAFGGRGVGSEGEGLMPHNVSKLTSPAMQEIVILQCGTVVLEEEEDDDDEA